MSYSCDNCSQIFLSDTHSYENALYNDNANFKCWILVQTLRFVNFLNLVFFWGLRHGLSDSDELNPWHHLPFDFGLKFIACMTPVTNRKNLGQWSTLSQLAKSSDYVDFQGFVNLLSQSFFEFMMSSTKSFITWVYSSTWIYNLLCKTIVTVHIFNLCTHVWWLLMIKSKHFILSAISKRLGISIAKANNNLQRI